MNSSFEDPSQYIDPETFNKFKEEMQQKIDDKITEAKTERANFLKQIDNLMKRIYLMEGRYKE